MADRFLYVRTEARLAACQPNLGPAEHDHHAAFAKMNQMPCPSVLKTLNIAKEDQINYKYIGSSLVYDPVKPLDPLLENTRLALSGNRGIFTHPNMRPRTAETSRKQQRGTPLRQSSSRYSSQAQQQVSHHTSASSQGMKKLRISQLHARNSGSQ